MISSGTYIELLMEILSIPAFSREEQDRSNFLESYLKGRGFYINRIQNNLLVTTDGKTDNKKLLINSHIDTVSPNTGWESDPYVPQLKGEKITALGSNDAGASVVSLITSFEKLAESGKANEVLLAISAEEEISGKNGMEALLPLLKNISFAIVGEPTKMQPAVAERGLMVIDGLAKGKSGHAARNEGVNSIYMVMEDIKGIMDLQFPETSEWLPEPTVNVTMINAGTNHNTVPGECTFVIDARSNDVYPNEKLLEIIQETCKTEVHARSLRLNASSLAGDHVVQKVIEMLNMKPFGSSTMSDMALLPMPAIKIGPGDSARSHTANEYVLIDEIEEAIEKYSKLIEEILKYCSMKLWEKDIDTKKEVMQFTVGNDPDYDKELAPYDVIGSMAHAIMLGETGLISKTESKQLVEELGILYNTTKQENFTLHPDAEDIHSHLEMALMDKLGDTGKKIHTARSRNDQVMTALMLMLKEEERLIAESVKELFDVLIQQGEKHKEIQIPGYTHMQVAMPSSIALWLGAYAESLVGDMMFTEGIVSAIDQSPLGSAAGYGSSFPIDRDLTANLAGFGALQISSASAQLSRGKMETLVGYGLSSIAMTLSRLAADAILFMSQNMNFISFPDELTTGSSIMPHKKNPDVLELIRAHCNKIIQLPSLLAGMSANLVSGYHRDFQLTKEILFPAIEQLKQCLKMMGLMISNMKVRDGILEEDTYKYIFSVEEVNKKVIDGATFRDAYREVAADIDKGIYKPGRGHRYTHVGSIGNPGLDRIEEKMEAALKQIHVKPAEKIFEELKTYYSK